MYISKILIKNFKCIQELTIIPNKNFNIIIGENNQGKTTIFEALQTWYRCYQLYIRNNKTDFYQGNNLYFPFKDLNFLRLSKDTDLFKSAPNEARISLTINDTNVDGIDVSFELQFKINRPQSISNAYLRISKISNQQFSKFSGHLKTKQIKLDDAIFLYQTNPIARVLSKEPFMNEGQIRKKIMRGKSQEVLRSKILLHNDLSNLESQVSDVLGSDVKFLITNENRKDKDEYVNLQVKNRGHSLDLHLQGSGLIQVTEIFATVDYLASKLNILLIDEPDSHIHLALQKKLMKSLKELDDNQSFIITHNDGFVSEASDGELFYLNQDSKQSKILEPLKNANLIKKDFGSPILTLEELNNSQNIVFVEGGDDKYYIEKILQKLIELNVITNVGDLKKCFYFNIRGKDNLKNKLDNNRRTLSQLFKDKKYVVITDKDFTTIENSSILNDNVKDKLGNNSEAFCHDGYCIESTLFSELDKLHKYFSQITLKDLEIIEAESIDILNKILSESQNVTSSRYNKLEVRFNSQKKNRPELLDTKISDVINDATKNTQTLKYLMNKSTIREYINLIEDVLEIPIVQDSASLTDEEFCNHLFIDYIDQIPMHGILYENHKILIEKIYGAQF